VSEAVDKTAEAHDCIQVNIISAELKLCSYIDAFVQKQPMGWTSEMVAEAYKVSRKKQDEYALISHTRAINVCDFCHFTLITNLD